MFNPTYNTSFLLFVLFSLSRVTVSGRTLILLLYSPLNAVFMMHVDVDTFTIGIAKDVAM